MKTQAVDADTEHTTQRRNTMKKALTLELAAALALASLAVAAPTASAHAQPFRACAPATREVTSLDATLHRDGGEYVSCATARVLERVTEAHVNDGSWLWPIGSQHSLWVNGRKWTGRVDVAGGDATWSVGRNTGEDFDRAVYMVFAPGVQM